MAILQGINAKEAIRETGVPGYTYYGWRKGHGGMRVPQAWEPKEIEKENAWLKKRDRLKDSFRGWRHQLPGLGSGM